MAFTAQDVKKLREMTNVGMMDCKKALQATDGDMDKAIDWLREKGLAKAAKKADRIAAEGVAYAAVIDGVGVVIEVNSETDFAAKIGWPRTNPAAAMAYNNTSVLCRAPCMQICAAAVPKNWPPWILTATPSAVYPSGNRRKKCCAPSKTQPLTYRKTKHATPWA